MRTKLCEHGQPIRNVKTEHRCDSCPAAVVVEANALPPARWVYLELYTENVIRGLDLCPSCADTFLATLGGAALRGES